jgi:hypothetical protein
MQAPRLLTLNGIRAATSVAFGGIHVAPSVTFGGIRVTLSVAFGRIRVTLSVATVGFAPPFPSSAGDISPKGAARSLDTPTAARLGTIASAATADFTPIKFWRKKEFAALLSNR